MHGQGHSPVVMTAINFWALIQVLQAKTKVANGKVFDMAVKLSQGDMPDQIMQVSQDTLYHCLWK